MFYLFVRDGTLKKIDIQNSYRALCTKRLRCGQTVVLFVVECTRCAKAINTIAILERSSATNLISVFYVFRFFFSLSNKLSTYLNKRHFRL